MTYANCQSIQPQATLPTKSIDGFAGAVQRLPATVLRTLLRWQERANEQAHLASLDDRLLSDMGMTRADVEREVSMPFWRPLS